MKKIANIVSENSIDVSKIFNVVKTMDETINGLPTLIIDYNYVDKNYPNFDIGTNCLGPNLYWTFKKTQNRDKYNADLKFFINKTYVDLLKNIPYFFVDLIQYQPKTIIKVVRKVNNFKTLYTYRHNNMLYLYGDKIIFGIDLKLLQYMGVNTDKLIHKIRLKSTVFYDDAEILIEYKKILIEIENQVRYIPYLLSTLNEKENIISDIYTP